MTDTETATLTGERADLLETLRRHRDFLRFTVRDLNDEQAAERPTVSRLCLGGLIKHVAETEQSWADFAIAGEDAMGGGDWSDADSAEANVAGVGAGAGDDAAAVDWWESRFEMAPGETLAGLLATYDEVAARTDGLVATLDLDLSHPLPEAPWYEKGASWSVRRVFLHLIAETSQHAGHADIIRETLDGQKTMG